MTQTLLYPLATALLGGVGTLVFVRGVFGRWFQAGRVRRCRRCGFDMSATEGHACPECAHAARCEAEHYAGRSRWPVAALGLALLLGAVGVGMTPGIRRDGWLHLLPMGVQTRVFHLESNGNSRWMFSERLEGREPTGGPGGFAISVYNDAVDEPVRRWREQSVRTAVIVLTRPDASASRVERAARIADCFADLLDPSAVDAIFALHGTRSPHLQGVVARWGDRGAAAARPAHDPAQPEETKP